MTLGRDRPEILSVPEHPQACCTQQTITAGPAVAAKTRQKHDYPWAQWRASYARRTAAERLNAGIKDPAINIINQGWIRQTGLTELMLWLACLMVVRNQRTLAAREKRQEHHTRAAARSRTAASSPALHPARHNQAAPARASRQQPLTPASSARPSATLSTPAHTHKPGNNPRQPQAPTPAERRRPDSDAWRGVWRATSPGAQLSAD